MIEIQPVALDAAIAHQQAITNASHLLSCSDYLLQSLPEETQELPILADLTILLGKVGDEISAARVKFETKEKVPPVAPWRNQQEQEQPQVEGVSLLRNPSLKDSAAYQATCDHVDAALLKTATRKTDQAMDALRNALGLQAAMIEEIDHLADMAGIECKHQAQHLAPAIDALIYEALNTLCGCPTYREPAAA